MKTKVEPKTGRPRSNLKQENQGRALKRKTKVEPKTGKPRSSLKQEDQGRA